MKKIYNLYKDFLIFILCCLISILLFLIKDTNNIKKVRFNISNLFSIIYSPKDVFNKLSSLEEENINLMNNLKIVSENNKVLEQRLRDTKKYFKYDDKLSKLIPNYNFIPGRIIEHSFTGIADFFTVNIGLKDGVPKDSKGVINFNGDLIVTVSVTDGEFSVSELFTLTVLPVDDPPSIDPIPDMEMLEGDTLIYLLVYSNIDGDDGNIQFFVQTANGSTGNEEDNFLSIIFSP